MHWSRIKHEHVARRKFSLWLQQGCIVTIYLHSVTLARVMSQTYGSTYLTSVCHRSLLLWTARERPATQRPRACKSQLSISATKALIINLSYFLPSLNALQYIVHMDSYNVCGMSSTPSIMLYITFLYLLYLMSFFLNILVHHDIWIFISTFNVFPYQYCI